MPGITPEGVFREAAEVRADQTPYAGPRSAKGLQSVADSFRREGDSDLLRSRELHDHAAELTKNGRHDEATQAKRDARSFEDRARSRHKRASQTDEESRASRTFTEKYGPPAMQTLMGISGLAMIVSTPAMLEMSGILPTKHSPSNATDQTASGPNAGMNMKGM